MTHALPEPIARSFTPDVQPQTLDVVVPVLDQLEAMPVASAEELEAFMAAWNEATCWIGDHLAKTRVMSRRFTNDEDVRAQWAGLVADVIPEFSRREDRLARKFLASPQIEQLEDGPYAPFLRKVRTDVELFREENIPLIQREEELTNTYQRISGGWVFDLRGESHTMSAMLGFFSDPDREVRREAFFAIAAELATTAEEVEELFEQLFEVRHQIAQNAGFDNYRDYMFAVKLRDYDADACHNFARVVREQVLGLVEEVARATKQRLQLDTFAPWDVYAEPDGGANLTPFEKTSELEDGVERMMRRLDPELGDQFAAIRENMDLEAREGKGQGGFMSWFAWDRRPFIFANSTGKHDDVFTLLHEAGHAFHALLAVQAGSMPMGFGMHTPTEFCEVASMAMELLHYDTLDEFYDADEASRAIQQHLRRVLNILPRTVLGDQFQHWLYTHPEHTRAERRAKWIELQCAYTPHVDYSEVDDELLGNSYHTTLHYFIVPFYFIEYAFAQFGALQVAMRAERDRAEALATYKEALKLGPQRDIRGLYEAAGAQFDPSPQTLRAAMDWVRARLI